MYCSSYTCGTGTTLMTGASSKTCTDGACDTSQCCSALDKCDSHSCPGGKTWIDAAPTTFCSAAGCSDGACCRALASCGNYDCSAQEALATSPDLKHTHSSFYDAGTYQLDKSQWASSSAWCPSQGTL